MIITDIIMPDMEGIEMIRQILLRKPAAKIIAISGGGRTGKVEFLKMAGMVGAMATLRKPIQLAKFLSVVKECLEAA